MEAAGEEFGLWPLRLSSVIPAKAGTQASVLGVRVSGDDGTQAGRHTERVARPPVCEWAVSDHKWLKFEVIGYVMASGATARVGS